jgi:hypothetical protein
MEWGGRHGVLQTHQAGPVVDSCSSDLANHVVTDDVCVLRLAGFAINAAVAFERQLGEMFFPLLSLATIVRSDPYYPSFNASFDRVAKELMDEVCALSFRLCVAVAFGHRLGYSRVHGHWCCLRPSLMCTGHLFIYSFMPQLLGGTGVLGNAI